MNDYTCNKQWGNDDIIIFVNEGIKLYSGSIYSRFVVLIGLCQNFLSTTINGTMKGFER